MDYFPSEQKYKRATTAVKFYGTQMSIKPGMAELRLVEQGKKEGIKDEDKLIEFVYNGLGGKEKLSGEKAKKAKTKADEAKKRAKKKSKTK